MNVLKRIASAIQNIRKPIKVGVPTVASDSELMKDRIAIVTGGSGDIGYAITKKIVGNGGRVIIVGRSEQKLKKVAHELGSNVGYVCGDIATCSTHSKIIAEAEEVFGKVPDVIVNSAGSIADTLFGDMNEDEWDRVMNINIKGLVFFTQTLSNIWIENMIKGRILNVSSASGGKPGWTVYQISKAALNSATVGMASVLARHGIVVNSIAPGPVQSSAINNGSENIHSEYPSGRITTVDEVAQWSVYLLSDFGAQTSGAILALSGGNGIYHLER